MLVRLAMKASESFLLFSLFEWTHLEADIWTGLVFPEGFMES